MPHRFGLQTSGARLAIECRINDREHAALALNHIAEACCESLAEQGAALQDYAVPALRWALLRIAVLEAEVGRSRIHRRTYSDSRPAPL